MVGNEDFACHHVVLEATLHVVGEMFSDTGLWEDGKRSKNAY